MQQQKFSIEEFLRIAIATTESLQQIHSANIIHKDINPSNIVFNPASGELKIIDFGICTQLTRENYTLKNPALLNTGMNSRFPNCYKPSRGSFVTSSEKFFIP